MQGVTVILHVKTKTGEDSYGNPVYTDNPECVDNVLIGPAGPAYPGDIAGALALTGQHAAYQLYVPKGDSHRWDGALIDFFGRRWKAVGTEEQWIEDLIPLEWNKRVSVERYVMPEDLDEGYVWKRGRDRERGRAAECLYVHVPDPVRGD